MSSQLFPEVLDQSTLQAKFTQPLYLPVGLEGVGDVAGDALAGQIVEVTRPTDASDAFGPSAELTVLCNALLGRGVAPIYAVASAMDGTATQGDRIAAWSILESDPRVRIRLTGSTDNADHVLLGDSCRNASLLNNKQFAVVGEDSGKTKANLLASAAALNDERVCLVGPGVYDPQGVLLDGQLGAIAVASELAKSSDPSDDLDLLVLPNLLSIEQDALGNAVFTESVVAAAVVNDFEDLLQGGVSPLMNSRVGPGVAISHLRTTFTDNSTWDALSTVRIMDQLFVDVRDYVYAFNYFRRQNTAATRELLTSGVRALLTERNNWIAQVTQPDGKLGYNVQVQASSDNRQLVVSYEGEIIRSVQTVAVAASFTIKV